LKKFARASAARYQNLLTVKRAFPDAWNDRDEARLKSLAELCKFPRIDVEEPMAVE
jgi:hypothetical protein